MMGKHNMRKRSQSEESIIIDTVLSHCAWPNCWIQ